MRLENHPFTANAVRAESSIAICSGAGIGGADRMAELTYLDLGGMVQPVFGKAGKFRHPVAKTAVDLGAGQFQGLQQQSP